MQPIIKDAHGTLRFRANPIVRVLLERAGMTLDEFIKHGDFCQEDCVQAAQLIGLPVDDTRFDSIRSSLPKPSALKTRGYDPQPMQPVYLTKHDTLRFRENVIVRVLLDRDTERGRIYPDFPARSDGGLNWIAVQRFSQADQEQFAQLIGYSISGYHELSYVSDESAAKASALAKKIMPGAGGCRDKGCPYHGGPISEDKVTS